MAEKYMTANGDNETYCQSPKDVSRPQGQDTGTHWLGADSSVVAHGPWVGVQALPLSNCGQKLFNLTKPLVSSSEKWVQ